jgi:hypothetical protein
MTNTTFLRLFWKISPITGLYKRDRRKSIQSTRQAWNSNYFKEIKWVLSAKTNAHTTRWKIREVKDDHIPPHSVTNQKNTTCTRSTLLENAIGRNILSLAPQPSLGLGLLHKIRLNFVEASQQFSFLKGRVVSPTPNPHPGGPGLCIYIPQRQGGYPFYSPLTSNSTLMLTYFPY